MKTCPVCRAVAFDDARTCFGCMHHFDDADQGGESESTVERTCAHDREPNAREVATHAVPPAFLVKMVPVLEETGAVSWTCSVDFVTT